MNRFFNGQAPFDRRQFWLACTFLALLALVLRLPTLGSRSLWLDETYSAWFSALPLAELWTSVPLYETHPPMYYTLLKGWNLLFGASEPAMRALSVLASVVSVVLLAASARLAGMGGVAQRVALLAALFLALNATSVNFAQQARPYALQTLAASAAILCSFVLLAGLSGRSPVVGPVRATRLWPWAAGLGIAAGCMLWLHNTGFFVALGIWSGLLVATVLFVRGRWRAGLLLAAAAGVLALLVWTPFLPNFLLQNAGLARMSYWMRFVPRELTNAWILPLGGSLVATPAVLLGALGIARLWKTRRDLVCHLLIVLLLAPLLMGAYSYLVKPVFVARLFVWMGPLLMAVLALGVFALPALLRMPATAVMLALSAFSTYSYYGKPTENWREMLTLIEARMQAGDLVLALPNEIQLPVAYYGRGKLAPRVVYLPQPFPALGMARTYIGNLGAPAVDGTDVAHVQALVQRNQRVWLIERRADLYDQQRTVAAALDARLRSVETIKGRGMTVTLYDVGARQAVR